MDIINVAVGGVIIASCVLPFVVMGQKGKKNEKKMLQSLRSIAAQNNAQITNYDFAGKFIIGLDEHSNNLFYLKKNQEKEWIQQVYLKDIKTCKVVNLSRTIKANKSTERVIERLELNFIPILQEDKNVVLEFYNEEESMQLTGELQLVEKWEKLINEQIKKAK
jgi:hypothetical protein